MDIREEIAELCDGRTLEVTPDIVADFRDMPFLDESFYLVVFDPPHLIRAGDSSWLAQKYGVLDENLWSFDIRQGFDECMRVLKTNGTLIFKWNEEQVSLYRWKRKNGLIQSQTRKESMAMPMRKEVTNAEVVKQLDAAMKRVAPLQETNEKLKAENEKLNEQIKNLGEFSNGQLEEIKGLNKQVRQHLEDNERLEKHLREANQKLDQLTESYRALEKNYEAANLDLEKLRAQNEELRTQNSSFRLDEELKDEMVEVLNNKLNDHFAVYQSNQDVSALDKVIKRAEQLKMLQ